MRKILKYIYLNGNIVNQNSASISPLNNGLLNGHGVFTTIKVRSAQPLFINRHLNRLTSNAAVLDIKISKINSRKLKTAAYNIIKKNSLASGGMRITITSDNILDHPASPNIIIYAFKVNFKIPSISVITLPDTRDNFKTIKTTCRLPNILAQKQAMEKGAKDALFTTEGNLIESTYANIFSIQTDNTIITPLIESSGLNGISRQILMENLPIQEKYIPATATNPIVLVNSLSMRIVENINGRKLKQNPSFFTAIRQALKSAENADIKQFNNKIVQ